MKKPSEKLLGAKKFVLGKVEIIRQKIASHPKIILLRLKLFGVYPALGKHFIKIAGIGLLLIFVFLSSYALFWRSPRPFPEETLISIKKGESLSQIADSFEKNSIVRSSFWLKVFIILQDGEKSVIAGDYYFPSAISVFKVARMLHNGQFGLIARKVTFPEGTSSMEMAEILKKSLISFNADGFKNEVSSNNYEGYLFPDTYFFMPNTSPSDIILMMKENFARQTNTYESDILKFKKPLNEVIIMASIIEEEANGSLETKRIVSGILWKRLRLDMPLQVDSAFKYYNGKDSYTLTTTDLKDDHKYNTYTNKGLPPTAITNPGIDSIRAAITPTQTEYLYFLSDKNGDMHYAKTFEQHKANKELYIK